jgi:RimJ/RimL family protein N-acetyltransferase
MRQPVLTARRLCLRPRTIADLDACVAMDLDPAVHRYVFPQAPDRKRHEAHLRARLSSDWPPLGGIWVVEWRATLGLLGWCGVFPLEDTGLIEIGYRYVRAAWGQGVATEAATAVLDHGFREFGFDPIVAVTHPDNRASQHVLEKIGLNRSDDAFHYGQQVAFYHLSRTEYLAARLDRRGFTN